MNFLLDTCALFELAKPRPDAGLLRWLEARRKGLSPPVIDAMLAATARAHGRADVTRNTSDFESLNINVENPWSR